MEYLDALDLLFIAFCIGALIYTLTSWARSAARSERMSEEMIKLQRETNELLRQLVDRTEPPDHI